MMGSRENQDIQHGKQEKSEQMNFCISVSINFTSRKKVSDHLLDADTAGRIENSAG